MTTYPFKMQLVVDPDNPRNVVAAGSVSIYDSEDTTHTTLLTLTDPSGVPISNPITSNANGFTPPFVTTSPEVLWVSGPYVDYFQSYKGMRDEAVAAVAAAEAAATTAGAQASAAATAALSAAVTDAETAQAAATASATAAANAAALVGAPADSAIAAAINGSATATKTALNSMIATSIAGKLDTTAPASGDVATWDAAAAKFKPKAQADIFVAHLGPSNGTDDEPAITAALNAARIAGGGTVKGKPGTRYLTGNTLVVGSKTTLDMAGCTVELKTGVAKNILQSYAFANPVRAVTDAAITSASTTLTSATGAFTSSDVGRSVTVAGAGPNGTGGVPVGPVHLSARIVSITNSTTVVLDTAASTTVSAATASIYTRDVDIALRGGKYISHNNGGAGTQVHHAILCRVDGLVVDFEGFVADTAGSKYGVYTADATNIDVSVRNMDTISDGVHLQGPIKGGTIRHIDGHSGDDFLAIGTADNTGGGRQLFTGGSITDLEIRDIKPTSVGTKVAVKLYGLIDHKIERVSIKGVRGVDNCIVLGAADVQGVYLDDIVIDDASIDTSVGVWIFANGGSLKVSNVSCRHATATSVVAAMNLVAGFSWNYISLDKITMPNAASVASGTSVAAVYGAVTDLQVSAVRVSLPTSGATLYVQGSTGSVTRAMLSKISQTGAGAVVKASTSGQTLSEVWLRDVFVTGASFLADFATATTLHLSNVNNTSPGNGSLNLRATSNVTVLGSGASKVSGSLTTAAGYALRINCPDFQADVSKITSSPTGDRVHNTNSAAAPYVASPLVRDPSAVWVPVSGYAKLATATLTAGTVTVADTKITANSRILVSVLVPGGTVGTPYVAARTAGTGFTITSTSGADTSVILYDILSY